MMIDWSIDCISQWPHTACSAWIACSGGSFSKMLRAGSRSCGAPCGHVGVSQNFGMPEPVVSNASIMKMTNNLDDKLILFQKNEKSCICIHVWFMLRDCSALSWICSSVRVCSMLKVLIEPRVAPTKRAPYAEHGSSKTEVHSEVFIIFCKNPLPSFQSCDHFTRACLKWPPMANFMQ